MHISGCVSIFLIMYTPLYTLQAYEAAAIALSYSRFDLPIDSFLRPPHDSRTNLYVLPLFLTFLPPRSNQWRP